MAAQVAVLVHCLCMCVCVCASVYVEGVGRGGGHVGSIGLHSRFECGLRSVWFRFLVLRFDIGFALVLYVPCVCESVSVCDYRDSTVAT